MAVEVTLAVRMKLKPGYRAAVLHAPEGYLVDLAPAGVSIDYALDGQYDWIQVFVKNRAEIQELFPSLYAALKPNTLLWISYPKATSGIQTDLSRDHGWDAVTGLKWVTLVSINTTWSAFAMRLPKPGEKAAELSR